MPLREACTDSTDLPAMLRNALQAGKPNGKAVREESKPRTHEIMIIVLRKYIVAYKPDLQSDNLGIVVRGKLKIQSNIVITPSR